MSGDLTTVTCLAAVLGWDRTVQCPLPKCLVGSESWTWWLAGCRHFSEVMIYAKRASSRAAQREPAAEDWPGGGEGSKGAARGSSKSLGSGGGKNT